MLPEVLPLLFFKCIYSYCVIGFVVLLLLVDLAFNAPLQCRMASSVTFAAK